jgi:hypothetical protein
VIGRHARLLSFSPLVQRSLVQHDYLQNLRRHHPAWRLLAADSAPLVVGFLHHCFVEPNVRVLAEDDLAAGLDDYLYHLRETLGEDAYPRAAMDYLRDWADDSRGWLRRYYPPDSDAAHYDLTPGAEQAIQWLASLEQRQFVGAESRLKLVFDLLQQIERGSETDPEARIDELVRRQQALDVEIEEIRAGRMAFMDDTQLRERFLQVRDTARALLADFRQVEQNFRELDRQVRERIATWSGSRGEVLAEVFGERDEIADSDQGRSFRAFWDLLMSPARQEELSRLLEAVLELEPVAALNPDPRLKRIHYDWLAAGELAQRTVARLSEQLRRYLDDQAWLENRRIMDVIRTLERHALAVRSGPPTTSLMAVDGLSPQVDLPLERPLFSPPAARRLAQDVVEADTAALSADVLFEQVYVDKDVLRARLRRALQSRRQATLADIVEAHPLEQGLAELVAWLSLATGESPAVVDETVSRSVSWTDAQGVVRTATVPEVIFLRSGADRTAPTGGGSDDPSGGAP